jgi:hypothetical protein
MKPMRYLADDGGIAATPNRPAPPRGPASLRGCGRSLDDALAMLQRWRLGRRAMAAEP